ncbi:MAG: hypothetical protein DLM66_02445 [Candidatus Dormiibacter spiritus]|nr:MAG: hypothetical protein DLM66_02445 [Candidatus Dormibacteraeota bacterium]
MHPFGIGGNAAPPAATGGPSWPGWDIARQVVLVPGSSSASAAGYVLDGWGALHPFAAGMQAPPPIPNGPSWPGWDIARQVVLLPDSNETSVAGYVLDGWGGLHPFSAGGHSLPPYTQNGAAWPGWDIARAVGLVSDSTGTSVAGYVLDGWGGLHPFNSVGHPPLAGVPAVQGQNYWPGWDIVHALVPANDGTSSGWTVDGWGGIHAFGSAPALVPGSYFSGRDMVRGAAGAGGSSGSRHVNPVAPTEQSLFVADGLGGVHAALGTPAVTSPPPGWTADVGRGLAVLEDGTGGYTLDGFGGLHQFAAGGNPPPPGPVGLPSWTWDIARGIALIPGSNSQSAAGYVLDGWGGLHPFGAGMPAPPPIANGPYWQGWDIARQIVLLPDSSDTSVAGYVLDGWGALHPFNAGGHTLPPNSGNGPSWPGWDIARAVGLTPDSAGTAVAGYVLDGWGGVHPFSAGARQSPPYFTNGTAWPGWDIARGLVMRRDAAANAPGGWVLDGWGGLHAVGAAPALAAGASWPGWDIAHAAAGSGGGAGSRHVEPPPPPLPRRNIIPGITYHHQEYELSCEEAAIQMALTREGINVSQTQVLNDVGIDWRRAYYDSNGTLRWGDAYTNFVGDPNGSEVALTGYGTYSPTIARVARQYGGRVLRDGEGINPQDLYDAVLRGHPVVAWVSFDWQAHSHHDYLAFDGRWVQYAGPVEHTVTVIGVDRDAGTVFVFNPWYGPQWISFASFEAAYQTYNQMAVVID